MARIRSACGVTDSRPSLSGRAGLVIAVVTFGYGCSGSNMPASAAQNPTIGQAGNVGAAAGSIASDNAGRSEPPLAGASGASVVTGASGTPGASGVAGGAGIKGTSGTTGGGGSTGASGAAGSTGAAGVAGAAGAGAAGSGDGETDVACTGDKGAPAVVQSYTQMGKGPSGPIPIVIETEPTLAGYTLYRPKDLTEKYPQFISMDGSCNLEGVGAFSEVLSEIASYGFITVVVGNPTSSGSEALSTDPKSMLKPLDWLYTENERPCSKYYHKILKNKAAASGQSCGGVHALGAGKDPRVATVVPMNSGLTGMSSDAQTVLSALHGSVAYLIGGSSDLAYSPAQGDYPALPKTLPAWYGNFGNVGHFYIFGQDNGGEFGRVAVAWLRWQLKDETGADTKGLFVGANCGLCSGTDWVIKSQNLN